MDRLDRCTFFVSDWKVEPLRRRLSRRDRTAQLEPKILGVLVYLARHAGEVVTREQLLEDVWPDTVVTDHALTRSISELRKVLEDDTKHPSIIETIPKTGYRLVAPVALEVSSDGEAGASSPVSFRPSGREADRRPRSVVTRLATLAAGVMLLTLVVFGAGTLIEAPPEAVSYTSKPLTSLPGREITPVFSPDGEQIAFAWTQGFYQANRDIYVRHLSMENSIPVTSGIGRNLYPAWSPDGDRLAFLRYTEESCGIYTVSALGTSERKLDECGLRIKDLVWSPDGRRLAFAGRESAEQPHRVYVMDLEDLHRTPLTNPPSHFHGDDQPIFSPDGRTIAFRRSRVPGIGDLYTIPLGKPRSTPGRRTFDQGYITGYDWTADGKELVFSSNRNGLFRYWRASLEDGSTRPETGISAWDPGRPAIARRGKRLAFVEWFYEVNVWEFPLTQDGDKPRAAVSSTRSDFLPSYSPDGRHIAFSSNRSGGSEIWVSRSDGSRPVRLTNLGHVATKAPSWSPDGSRLAFESVVDGFARVYVIDSEGGTPRAVVADTSDAIAPGWSRDGKAIYFGSNRSGEWHVWRVPVSGGSPERITTSSGYVGRESPDGRDLYFTRYDRDGIWRIPLGGGREEQVVEEFPASTWSAWAVHEDGVYYLRRTPEGGSIFRTDAGHETKIADFACTYMEHGSGLSLSPDRSRVLTSCIDRAESDIMLVEGYR